MTCLLTLRQTNDETLRGDYDERTPSIISFDQFNQPNTRLLYIGGIYNLVGQYPTVVHYPCIKQSLADHPQSKVDYFFLSVTAETDIKGLSDLFFQVQRAANKTGTLHPTPYATKTVNQIILPDNLIRSWTSLRDPKPVMRDYFARLCLIGFSRGHMLIQQLDTALQTRLERCCLPPTPLSEATAITYGGETAPLRHGRIQQLCIYRSNDLFIDERFRKELFADCHVNYPVQRIGNAICLGERAYDNTLRTISHNPETQQYRMTSIALDHGHDFWLYTNHPITQLIDGSCVFTNASTGAILSHCITRMLAPRQRPFRFDTIPSIAALCSQNLAHSYGQMLRSWSLNESRKIFAIQGIGDRSAPEERYNAIRKALCDLVPAPLPQPG